MTEQPYPEMTDQDVLENLLNISLVLLKLKDVLPFAKIWGNQLWDIHKYLESRLMKTPGVNIGAMEELNRMARVGGVSLP